MIYSTISPADDIAGTSTPPSTGRERGIRHENNKRPLLDLHGKRTLTVSEMSWVAMISRKLSCLNLLTLGEIILCWLLDL